MPRRHPSTSAQLNVNLTPLLDIVLQLITFFMMLVHFGTRLEGATKAVRLPVAPAALPGSDLTFDRLSVVLDARGRLQSGDQWLTEDDAAAWWSRQARARRAGLETLTARAAASDERKEGLDAPRDRAAASEELPTVVIVRADRAASYGAVRRTLATAQDQGFAHFSLVVLRRQGR